MKFCPECGKQLEGSAGFCGGCGNKIQTAAETVAQPPSPSKKSYKGVIFAAIAVVVIGVAVFAIWSFIQRPPTMEQYSQQTTELWEEFFSIALDTEVRLSDLERQFDEDDPLEEGWYIANYFMPILRVYKDKFSTQLEVIDQLEQIYFPDDLSTREKANLSNFYSRARLNLEAELDAIEDIYQLFGSVSFRDDGLISDEDYDSLTELERSHPNAVTANRMGMGMINESIANFGLGLYLCTENCLCTEDIFCAAGCSYCGAERWCTTRCICEGAGTCLIPCEAIRPCKGGVWCEFDLNSEGLDIEHLASRLGWIDVSSSFVSEIEHDPARYQGFVFGVAISIGLLAPWY